MSNKKIMLKKKLEEKEEVLNNSSSEESDSDSNSSSSEESDSDSNNKKCNLLEVLDDILKTKSYRKIADSLNVSVGTITRWKKLENVPIQYQFDLMKLNKNMIITKKTSFIHPKKQLNIVLKYLKRFLMN